MEACRRVNPQFRTKCSWLSYQIQAIKNKKADIFLTKMSAFVKVCSLVNLLQWFYLVTAVYGRVT